MSETPNLKLPYLAAAQSQKHVTLNEALRALDAVIQLGVADRDATIPPASPAEGARYIVGSSPSGAWSGYAGQIAAWQDGAWMFHPPGEGWLAWAVDEEKLLVYNGAAWIPVAGSSGGGDPTNLTIANRTATALDIASSTGADATVPAATGALAGLMVADDKTKLDGIAAGADVTPAALQSRTMVGINATADATNRLAVSSLASLFNHEGNGHQVKVNKAAAADTASFLFQTAFAGRAEMGTTGDDDFHFKVSADGAAWKEALVIDRATGAVSFPELLKIDKADILALTEATTIDNAADFLLLQTAAGLRRKVKPTNLGLGGEANTASNVGTSGIGLFKVKSGVDLQFRNLDAGSAKLQISLDAGTNRVLLDLGTLTKADVGLANVDNTSDLAKPISTATQTALDGKASTAALTAHTSDTANPHAVTKAQVGLANVDNTSDLAKPISTATQAALDNKAALTHTHTASEISDSGATGRSLLQAATSAAATAILDTVTRTNKGLAPPSGGTSGTTKFLREDLTWEVPAGGGGSGITQSLTVSPAFGIGTGLGVRGGPAGMTAVAAATAVTAGRLYMALYDFGKARTLTTLTLIIGTAGAAGTKCRVGLYELDANGCPDTLIQDFGEIATDATGVVELTISRAVEAKLYWLGFVFSGTPALRLATIGGAGIHGLKTTGTPSAITHYYRSFTYGPLPTDETANLASYTFATTGVPYIGWA
jgi:hypothetical protein